jgi:hypothetical protein
MKNLYSILHAALPARIFGGGGADAPTSLRVVDMVWNEAVEQSGRIAVFDLFGRQLQQIQVPVGSIGQNLSLRHLPEGMYVVRTWLDNQEFVNKLVIKH